MLLRLALLAQLPLVAHSFLWCFLAQLGLFQHMCPCTTYQSYYQAPSYGGGYQQAPVGGGYQQGPPPMDGGYVTAPAMPPADGPYKIRPPVSGYKLAKYAHLRAFYSKGMHEADGTLPTVSEDGKQLPRHILDGTAGLEDMNEALATLSPEFGEGDEAPRAKGLRTDIKPSGYSAHDGEATPGPEIKRKMLAA